MILPTKLCITYGFCKPYAVLRSLFRLWLAPKFNPAEEETGQNGFHLDSKEPDWSKFQNFILDEVRYNSLLKTFYKLGCTSAKQTSLFCIRFARIFPEEAKELFVKTEQFAKLRYEGYKKLIKGK